MDFGFTDTQEAIRETAREFLAARFTSEKVRELAASESPYDDAIWNEICGLGWPGIAIAEEHGGQGLGVVELAILLEQLGHAIAPAPLIANACAGLLIERAGSEEQRRRWLPGIASGEARGAAALTPDDEPIVGAAGGASVLVLGDGDGARIVEPSGARLERIDLIDATRAYFRVAAEGGDALPGDVAPALGCAIVAFAAELVGIAQRALEMAVAHASEREQFGRPIGAYQAVSHRCVGMLYETEEARSLTYYAAWCADADPAALPLAASMAKARASDAAVTVTNAALQVLGGIGFTWEHDLHFLLKRAEISARMLGSAWQHRDRVAGLAGLE